MLESLLSFSSAYYADRGKKRMQANEHDSSVEKTIISRGLENPSLPLYVNIPFCKSLCPFCSFNRYLAVETRVRAYYTQLYKELELYAGNGYRFTSLHVGGGTPTVLMDELVSFIDKAKSMFDIRAIDVESTPNEINDVSIEALRGAGVSRLSMGVQTFDDRLLREIGRSGYDGSGALEKMMLAKGRFDTVAIDLIFNFPTQTEESFTNDILLFKSSGIEQATFYPLMPGPHKSTLIERRFGERFLQYKGGPERERRFYSIIRKNLLNDGYRPDTVWCFSRKQSSMDEYIVNSTEYIGIGAGSISLLDDTVYVNSFSPDKYSKYTSEGSFPVINYIKLSRREYFLYKLLMSLFGTKFARPGRETEESEVIGKELLLLELAGIIRKEDDKFRVTEYGMYYVSILMKEFLSSLNGLRETYIEMQL